MKPKLFIVSLGIILTSCHTDNFYDTTRKFITDKLVYCVGDTIELTATILPEKEKKLIRFYENFKNLQLSFSLMNDSLDTFNGEYSQQSGSDLPETEIEDFIITKDNPFEKSFRIIIQESDDIILNIPELRFQASFESNMIFDPNTRVRIHGFCNPINPEIAASLEENFDVVDIQIVNE